MWNPPVTRTHATNGHIAIFGGEQPASLHRCYWHVGLDIWECVKEAGSHAPGLQVIKALVERLGECVQVWLGLLHECMTGLVRPVEPETAPEQGAEVVRAVLIRE